MATQSQWMASTPNRKLDMTNTSSSTAPPTATQTPGATPIPKVGPGEYLSPAARTATSTTNASTPGGYPVTYVTQFHNDPSSSQQHSQDTVLGQSRISAASPLRGATSFVVTNSKGMIQCGTNPTNGGAAAQQQHQQQLPATCTCLKTLERQFSKGQYAECVELGIHFLTQAQSVPQLEDLVEAVQYVGTAMVAQCELERARGVFALQLRAIHHCRWGSDEHCGPSKAKKKWLIRHHRNMAVLEEADGHREEAIKFAVEQWRGQAELFGPESLTCVKTYAWIADLRLSLGESSKAMTMLEHATRLLNKANAKETDPTTWVRVHRSVAELLVASGNPTECLTAAAHLQQVILILQGQLRTIEEDEFQLANNNKSPPGAADSGEGSPDALAATATFKPSTNAGGSNKKTTRLATEDAKYHLTQLSQHKEASSIEYGGALVQYATALLLTAGGQSESQLAVNPAAATEGALCFLEEADGIFEAVLPKFDVLAVRTRIKLCQLQFEMGHIPLKSLIDKMCEVQEALTQEEVRGIKHLQVLVEVREALGDAFSQGRFHQQANETYEKSLSLARQLFAPDHEVCAVLQHKLSESCISCARYDDALHMLKELLQWAQDCPADRKPPVQPFAILHSLGNVMRVSEQFDQALSYYQQTLRCAQGKEGPTKAKILGSMGAVHQTIGQLPEAVSLFQEALRVKMQCYGKIHLEVASTLQQLAALYLAMGLTSAAPNPGVAVLGRGGGQTANMTYVKDSVNCAERAIDIMQRLGGTASANGNTSEANVTSGTGAGSSVSATAPSTKGKKPSAGFMGTNSTISGASMVAEQSAHVSQPAVGVDHPLYLQCAKIKAQGVRLQKATHQNNVASAYGSGSSSSRRPQRR